MFKLTICAWVGQNGPAANDIDSEFQTRVWLAELQFRSEPAGDFSLLACVAFISSSSARPEERNQRIMRAVAQRSTVVTSDVLDAAPVHPQVNRYFLRTLTVLKYIRCSSRVPKSYFSNFDQIYLYLHYF